MGEQGGDTQGLSPPHDLPVQPHPEQTIPVGWERAAGTGGNLLPPQKNGFSAHFDANVIAIRNKGVQHRYWGIIASE